jgi:hypothetical protein
MSSLFHVSCGGRRLPRRVSNMQNIDGVATHPVKDPKWIAHDCSHADLRALRNARSGVGCTANAINHTDQPAFDGFGGALAA